MVWLQRCLLLTGYSGGMLHMLKAELINPFLEGAIVFFKHDIDIEILR